MSARWPLTPVVDLLGQVLLAVIYAVVYIMFLVLAAHRVAAQPVGESPAARELDGAQPFQPLSPR